MFVFRARDAGVHRGGLRGLERRLRGNDVGLRRHPRIILVLGDLQRPFIAPDRVLQHAVEFVSGAEFDVIRRQQRLFGQAGFGQCGGVGLGGGNVTLDLPAYTAPDVDFPGGAGFQAVLCAGAVAAAEAGGACAAAAAGGAGDGGGDAQRWVEAGARFIDQRLGVAKCRLVGGQRLVADVHLAFEFIQKRIVEDEPPCAARRRILWSCQFPARHFLEDCGHRRLWPMIIRAHHASTKA